MNRGKVGGVELSGAGMKEIIRELSTWNKTCVNVRPSYSFPEYSNILW